MALSQSDVKPNIAVNVTLPDKRENLNQLSHEVLKAIPSFISAIGAIITTAVGLVQVYNPLIMLKEFISIKSNTSRTYAEDLVDKARRFFPVITKHRHELLLAVGEEQEASAELRAEVTECIQTVANVALGLAFGMSAIGLAVEAGRLFFVWRGMRHARHYEKDGFVVDKILIQESVGQSIKLGKEIKRFCDGLAPQCYANLDDNQLLIFHFKKTQERNSVGKLRARIANAMGMLRARIDENIQTLSIYSNAAIPAAIGQILQCSMLAVNTVIFWKDAHLALRVVVIICIVCHVVTIGCGFFLMYVCTQTMKMLKDKLLKVETLQNKLNTHQEKIDTYFEQFTNNLINDNESQSTSECSTIPQL